MNLGEIQLDFNYYKRNSLNIRFFSKYLINAKCKNILIIPQNQIKKVYPNPSHEGVNSRITFGCWHPRKNVVLPSIKIIPAFIFFYPDRVIASSQHAVIPANLGS